MGRYDMCHRTWLRKPINVNGYLHDHMFVYMHISTYGTKKGANMDILSIHGCMSAFMTGRTCASKPILKMSICSATLLNRLGNSLSKFYISLDM